MRRSFASSSAAAAQRSAQSAASPFGKLRSAWGQHWASLAAREQSLVLLAAGTVALALLWWALTPAWQTLRQAPTRHQVLDAQLAQVQTLQAEALALRDAPRRASAQSLEALRQSVASQLGASAQLQINGDRATVTLNATPAPVLASWLAQVRNQTGSLPLEARLTQTAAAPAALATPAAAPSAAPSAAPATASARRRATLAALAAPALAPTADAAASDAGGAVRWSGTLVLGLPNP